MIKQSIKYGWVDDKEFRKEFLNALLGLISVILGLLKCSDIFFETIFLSPFFETVSNWLIPIWMGFNIDIFWK